MEFKIFIALIALFFIITFLQSGIDKLMHQEGNLSWFKSQFDTTILGKLITPLFWIITIQELVTGGFLIYIMYQFLFCNTTALLKIGFLLCLSTLVQLFFGQRIAKDYVGASGIISYIIVAMLGFVFSFVYQIYF